jgi:ABC-type multidrug transport system fused ATPase/permease subunit
MKKVKLVLGNTLKLLAIIWHEDKKLTLSYFISSLAGAILLFVVYFMYKMMIDRVAANAVVSTQNALAIVILSYLFFEYLSRFVNFTFNQYYFDYFIRMKLQNALTRKLMDKLGRMDFAHLEQGSTRNLIAKVENSYATRLPEILKTMNAIVYNIAALLFSLIIALQFSPIYFIILALVSAPVYYLRAKYGNIAFSSYNQNAHNTNYILYLRSLFTNFQTLSEMKIYGLRAHFLHKTKVLQDKVLEDYRVPMMKYTILSTLSFILVPMAIYFSIVNFISGIKTQTYTIGDFTFFLNTLFTFSGQISSILINLGAIYENSLFLNDFFSLMSIKNNISNSSNAYIFPKTLPRKIKFENVSFTYPGASRPSLQSVNFTINKGEDVAIVGHNGAGKSTLIKLLFRFYDPSEGRILIDGIDLRRIDLESWYAHLGVLFQDFARYFLTLKDNILFGNIDSQAVDGIAPSLEKAQGEELLKLLPKGYDQYLGRWFEGGMEMSGGQWQKVAIARAIYRNAPLLIMDEPTSAIDADAEAQIFSHISNLYEDKNLIFISHRFSTVRNADKIVVLSGGTVVEQGTHQKLVDKMGLYAKYFMMQKKGYE